MTKKKLVYWSLLNHLISGRSNSVSRYCSSIRAQCPCFLWLLTTWVLSFYTLLNHSSTLPVVVATALTQSLWHIHQWCLQLGLLLHWDLQQDSFDSWETCLCHHPCHCDHHFHVIIFSSSLFISCHQSHHIQVSPLQLLSHLTVVQPCTGTPRRHLGCSPTTAGPTKAVATHPIWKWAKSRYNY